MRSSLKKANSQTFAALLLSAAFLFPQILISGFTVLGVSVFLGSGAYAQEEENVYGNLSANEASTLINRLLANQSLLEKLTPAMKAQLAEGAGFQEAIEHQQRTFLEKRNAGEMLTLKRLVQSLYLPDSKVRQHFELVSRFGEKLEHVFATGDLQEFHKLETDKTLTEDEHAIVESQYLSYLHSTASDLIHSNQTLEALPLLALVPKEKRSTETWELVRQAVSGLIAKRSAIKPEILEDPQVQALLADLGERDPGSRQSMVEILAAQVLAEARSGKVAETRRYLSLLRAYRPDPANDDLIRQTVLDGTGAVQAEFTPELVEELKSRGVLSNETKLRLVFKGYYGPIIPALIFLSLLFPVLGLAAFGFILIQRKVRGASLPQMPKMPKIMRKKEKILPGYMRPVEVEDEESEDEYSRLLKMFGLLDSASENQIKRAYRDRMKALHPDRVSEDGLEKKENSEEFRELKHAYDRIFEIRKSWFRGRKGNKGS